MMMVMMMRRASSKERSGPSSRFVYYRGRFVGGSDGGGPVMSLGTGWPLFIDAGARKDDTVVLGRRCRSSWLLHRRPISRAD